MKKTTCGYLAAASIIVAFGTVGVGCGGDDSALLEPGTGGSADASTDRGHSGGSAGRDGGSGGGTGGIAGASGAGGSAGSGGSGGTSGGDAQADDGGADVSTGGSLGDGGTPEAGSGGAPVDGGSDAPVCTVGAACTLGGGGNGVLNASCVCQACSGADAPGDLQCTTAYGPGNLCISGACTAATCRATTGAPTPTCAAAGQICNGNQCAPCAATADCTAVGAYGAGYVCANGACVQGECVTSTDCHNLGGAKDGQVCGAGNSCGACTSDSNCGSDGYYASVNRTICDGGKCVANSCAVSAGPTSCATNHLCCATVCLPNTTFSSTAGPGKSCCLAADCVGTGANNCVGNACTACANVTLNTGTQTYDFIVDPSSGTDAGASGADSGGCRFKTVGYAINFAKTFPGVGPATPARILVTGDVSPSTGELFPLVVPSNVKIVGQGGTRTILVPAATNGFTLSGNTTGLSNLVIDGVAGSAGAGRYSRAIVAQVGSGTAQTGATIDHVTVKNSDSDAILVGGQVGPTTFSGNVTIGPGVKVTGSGVNVGDASGLLVGGTGTATITGGAAAADQTAFNDNTQHGIFVIQSGAITINVALSLGSPTTAAYDNSPVAANHNQHAGLYIAQTPTGGSTNSAGWVAMLTNNVTGLVALNTQAGNGIRFEGGSKVKLRGSVAYGNAGSGVDVTTSARAAALQADRDFIGGIDLGNTDPGNNVLQVPGVPFGTTPPNGQKPNGGAGICLAITRVANNGQVLHAISNQLVQSGTNQEVNCATAAASTLVVQRRFCFSAPSTQTTIGIPTSVGITGTVGNANTVDVTNCKGQ